LANWYHSTSTCYKGLYQEFEREYLVVDINNKKVKCNIPPELVINADQAPSLYVSVGRKTMAQCASKSMPVKD